MKKEINYARKHAKDFNFLTSLYQLYAVHCLFMPICSLFYRVKISGKENMQKRKRYLCAANHISYCDPFLVTYVIGLKNAFMAKKELYESNEYLAKNIFQLGAFAVNREKLEVSTIKSAKEVFKAGWGLSIFPQGGIKKNKKIEAISKGFVVFAKMAKISILPIAISGLEDYNWKIFRRQRVDVKIGEPISWELDDQEIIQNWREQIASMAGYELCNSEETQRALQKT